MSFQWTLIAGFLYFQIAIVLIFILPLVDPRKWQQIFNSRIVNQISKYSALYFYVILAILILFLLDAIKDIKKYSNITEHVNLASEMKGSIRLFRAQRNFYITFFSIFLSFVIRRLIAMIDIQGSLISKSEAIIKEAEAAKDLACSTVQEHENLITIEKLLQESEMNLIKEHAKDALQKYELEKTKNMNLQSDNQKMNMELIALKGRFDIKQI